MILLSITLLCASCAGIPAPEPIAESCIATDGDSIRCGEERIRLLAVDAPEMPGHCRKSRKCAPGDPFASLNHLRQSMAGKDITVQRIGLDRYGRTLAHVFADGHNLSCAQLSRGHAIYVRRWDRYGLLRDTCSEAKNFEKLLYFCAFHLLLWVITHKTFLVERELAQPT